MLQRIIFAHGEYLALHAEKRYWESRGFEVKASYGGPVWTLCVIRKKVNTHV